jgi:hypothetical protein
MDVMQRGFNLPVSLECTTANKLLARLFSNAGVQYKRRPEQIKDWKKSITEPITLATVYRHTKESIQ